MFDVRFLSCILSWQPKNKFHGLLRFLRFFKFCTYNYILQCFNVSLKVPGFYYWVLVCWLDSSLEITFMLWPPCVTSEYSPAVGPALLSGGIAVLRPPKMLPLPKRGGKGGEGEGSRPMPIIFAESDHVTWNLRLHTIELNSSPDVGFVHPIPYSKIRVGVYPEIRHSSI